MDWEKERYVRLFTRDTADWLDLSWDAQALLMQLLRKVDRAGVLPLGKHGKRAVAIVLNRGDLWERIEPALDELLRDGCISIEDNELRFRNFVEAQETRSCDSVRKQDQRDRDKARLRVGDRVSPAVTSSHQQPAPSPAVTSSHQTSPDVTPCRAVPCRTVPETLAGAPPAPPPDSPPLQLESPPAAKPRKQYPELVAALCAAYLEARGTAYRFQDGKDGTALSGMLKHSPPDEVLRRWRLALQSDDKWKRCNTVAQLASKWNDVVDTGPPRDWKRGRVGAEEVDWTNQQSEVRIGF